MKRTHKDMYFKKIRNLHKAMKNLDEVDRIQFKKETGFTEKEDSRAIGRGSAQVREPPLHREGLRLQEGRADG